MQIKSAHSFARVLCAVFILTCLPVYATAENPKSDCFVIRAVDEETGRGVPLVEIQLTNDVRYWTDSAGVAVIDEPALTGQEVFFKIRSDGYEFTKKTLMGMGAVFKVKPGTEQRVSLRRTMIAERLYRLTGEGIYRDSVLAGLPTPMQEPLLNAQIVGQDTACATIYKNKLFWIWGDTTGPAYWNFNVSAATSDLEDDPAVALNYTYFKNAKGQAKQMLPMAEKGFVWIEGLIPMKDNEGRERLVATYTRQQGLKPPSERGLALYDDREQVFKPWIKTGGEHSHVSSHPFLHDGYLYLYPSLRIPNDWNSLKNPSKWEQRDVVFPRNAGKPSCVVWNKYRKRWILLLEDFGAVYYAEAVQPEGPYTEAVKIIHHDKYNFYNVVSHTFFNQEDDRVIYLQGTYTDTFVKAEKTPRYNYNQIMYRLRLDDPRLQAAQK